MTSTQSYVCTPLFTERRLLSALCDTNAECQTFFLVQTQVITDSDMSLKGFRSLVTFLKALPQAADQTLRAFDEQQKRFESFHTMTWLQSSLGPLLV